jgi:hypothetical protein
MKKITTTALLATATLFCGSLLLAQNSDKQPPAQQKKQKQAPLPGAGTGGNTVHATTSTVVAGNRITVVYGRPGIKHPRTGEVRKVWGGLVPWDKADRLGADEATLLITERPLAIGEVTIPAGAHTLYIVPSENGTSKLAFSSRIGKWGIPVDETKDIARVDLKKDALAEPVEQLTIAIENAGGDNGLLKISWETAQFSLPFAVKRA